MGLVIGTLGGVSRPISLANRLYCSTTTTSEGVALSPEENLLLHLMRGGVGLNDGTT